MVRKKCLGMLLAAKYSIIEELNKKGNVWCFSNSLLTVSVSVGVAKMEEGVRQTYNLAAVYPKCLPIIPTIQLHS